MSKISLIKNLTVKTMSFFVIIGCEYNLLFNGEINNQIGKSNARI